MTATFPVDIEIPLLISRIGQVVDLDKSAFECGALLRRRKVRSPQDLLHLILLYSLGRFSLRTTAAFAAQLALAELSDVALLGRFQASTAWLEHILSALLAVDSPPAPGLAGRALTIVDGSSLSIPGSTGTDWRLHLCYDPVRQRLCGVRLSDGHTAESLSHFPTGAGTVTLADRGLAKARDLCRVPRQGGDFLVRTGWRALVLRQPDGRRFDLIGTLRRFSGTAPVSIRVGLAPSTRARARLPVRLVIAPKPPETLAAAGKRVQRKASKGGNKIRSETELAANFLILVTTLDAERFSEEQIVALYWVRWQIELAIKRLKSILGIKYLLALDPRLAKTWILANLICAVLLDEFTHDMLDFFPPARP
jgi:Transposase DDE domain